MEMLIFIAIYLVLGFFLAKVCVSASEKVEEIADGDEYSRPISKSSFGFRLLSGHWLTLATIITLTVNLCLIFDRKDQELEQRIEVLEQKVEQLEAVNQIDTIVIHRFIDEKDLF